MPSLPASSRLAIVLAFAAGGAAVAALFLVEDVPAWLLAVTAVVCAAYGVAAVFARRPFLWLMVTSLPASLAIVWPPLATVAGPGIVDVGILALFFAAMLVVVFAAPVLALSRARRELSLDARDRILVAASTWLAAIAGTAAWMSNLGPVLLGVGGWTSLAHALALALGATLAALVLARDWSRLRLLKSLTPSARERAAPADHEVVPVAEAASLAAGAVVLPWLGGRAVDGALLRRGPDGASPFRSVRETSLVAWLPLDLAAARRFVARRAALAALLLVTQAAGALLLAADLWLHRAPLGHVISVATSGEKIYQRSCALRDDGRVLCWGADAPAGPAWVPARRSLHPRLIPGLDDVTQLAVDLTAACALRRSGEVLCWKSVADPVPRPPAPGFPLSRRLSLGDGRGCALTLEGQVACFLAGDETWSVVSGLTARGAGDLLVRGSGGCLTRGDGLECWDETDDPTARGRAPPCLRGNKRWKEEPPRAGTLGWSSTGVCGVLSNGTIRCWGRESGYGSDPRACIAPAPYARAHDVTQVAWAGARFCTVDAGGRLLCWRDGDVEGPTLDGDVQPRIADVVQISAATTRCAVRRDGTVSCWGPDNSFGQLGDGTRRTRKEPELVRE